MTAALAPRSTSRTIPPSRAYASIGGRPRSFGDPLPLVVGGVPERCEAVKSIVSETAAPFTSIVPEVGLVVYPEIDPISKGRLPLRSVNSIEVEDETSNVLSRVTVHEVPDGKPDSSNVTTYTPGPGMREKETSRPNGPPVTVTLPWTGFGVYPGTDPTV
jgi:hypothetical protein